MLKVDAVVHMHQEPDRTDQILSKLDSLGHLVNQIGDRMSAEMDRLTREVSETRTVMQSAAVLLGQLSERIRALQNDPAALNALADELDAQQGELASAVAANTPSAPEEPPTT